LQILLGKEKLDSLNNLNPSQPRGFLFIFVFIINERINRNPKLFRLK
jgi:hypothetical protein